MKRYSNHRFAKLSIILALVAGPSAAQDASNPFPAELLDQPETIATGKDVFNSTCKFCHGKSAYPGKAPKLNPSRYTPQFVFERVTNGFRGMPPFKDTHTEDQRRAVAAYVMSKGFTN